MKLLCRILYIFIVLVVFPVNLNAGVTVPLEKEISHNLQVKLFPEGHRLVVKDTITIPDTLHQEFHFLLHRGLGPESPTPGVIIKKETDVQEKTLFDSFKVMLPAGLQDLHASIPRHYLPSS